MQESLYKYGQKAISFLIVLTLLVNWQILSMIGSFGLTLANNLLIIVWVILLFISAVGLYKKQSWGFFFLYPSIILTTIGFSISIIPFVTSIFPTELRPWIMIANNSMLLIISIGIHWGKSKRPMSEIA